jgi:glycosidase
LFKNSPDISDLEALQRTELAYAMLFTLRGVPVIYYGDEQGFAGMSDDMGARQDMFASRVASFNSERAIGGRAVRGVDHFNTGHVLYRALRDLAALRASQPALRRGRQLVRAYSDKPGLFAVSRFDPESGREILIAFNTSQFPIESQVQTQSGEFRSLRGTCATRSIAGSYHVTLAPLDFVVCTAQ